MLYRLDCPTFFNVYLYKQVFKNRLKWINTIVSGEWQKLKHFSMYLYGVKANIDHEVYVICFTRIPVRNRLLKPMFSYTSRCSMFADTHKHYILGRQFSSIIFIFIYSSKNFHHTSSKISNHFYASELGYMITSPLVLH